MSRNIPAWLTPAQVRAFGLAPVTTKRAPLVFPRAYAPSGAQPRKNAQTRRARLMEAKRCINGWNHGKATHGTRCKRCALARRKNGGRK